MRQAVLVFVGLGLVLAMAVPAAAQSRTNNIMSSASFLKAAQSTESPALNLATAPMFAAPKTTAPEGHVFGIGVRFGGGAFSGVGLSMRYWLSEVLGIEVGLSHSGYAYYGTTSISGSVLYIFKTAELGSTFDLNVYGGGGVDIAFYSGAGYASDTGIGFHGMAGVEFILKSNPKISFGADAGYYHLPGYFGYSAGGIATSGFFHYYIK